MAVVVLDASVIIGFLDREDGLHPAAVAAIRAHQNDTFVIPATVYCEILVNPVRAGQAAIDEVHAFLEDIGAQGADTTFEVAAEAARLRADAASEGMQLRTPDALVIATGNEIAADVVLTGDRRWRSVTPLAKVIEPPDEANRA